MSIKFDIGSHFRISLILQFQYSNMLQKESKEDKVSSGTQPLY